MYNFICRIKYKLHILISFLFYKPFFKKSGSCLLIINPIILSPSNIEVGKNFVLRNNGRLEAVKEYQNEQFNPQIIIGDNVRIEQNLHLTCAKKITIGDNTAIANNVTITDIDHPYEDISTIIECQRIKLKEVAIGSGCKIFSNVVILQGVTLGQHTVVAANSVVTNGNYPNFCVLAGAPARIVKRYNFTTQTWEKV